MSRQFAVLLGAAWFFPAAAWHLPVVAQPFVDVSAALGLPLVQHSLATEVCEAPRLACIAPTTGGAAVGDFDNDGYPDILYTRYGLPDALFRNLGDGTFVDVASEVGLSLPLYSNGALFVDVDNDGDVDVLLTHAIIGRHALFINQSAPTSGETPRFADEGRIRGVDFESTEGREISGFSAAAGDYDRDGWSDLFVTEWVGPVSNCGADHSRLLRNRGQGRPGSFTDITHNAGVRLARASFPIAYNYAASFRDLDQDGFQDIAVIGDFGTSRLFWNSGDGTFIDGGRDAGVGTDQNGMGSSFADVDRDGDFDWFVSSIHVNANPAILDEDLNGNRLYTYGQDRHFDEAAATAGIAVTGWPWGAALFDADHDGDHDLTVTAGILFGETPSRMWFFTQEQPLNFVDRTAQANLAPDTFDPNGRGLVTLDYDLDGDLDVFVVRNGGAPFLFRNDGGSALGDWLKVYAEGRVSTRDAFGTLVRVTPNVPGATTMLETTDSNTDFLGQSERVAHFGLGPGFATGGGTVDVEVTFLSGHVVTQRGVTPNQSIRVIEPTSPAPRPPAGQAPTGCAAPPDPCELDCNSNGQPDACDVERDPSIDCDENAVIDVCEFALGLATDCNANDRIDTCELADGSAQDCNANHVPDVCETDPCPVTVDAGGPVDAGRPGGSLAGGSLCSAHAPGAPLGGPALAWLACIGLLTARRST